jgi:ribonuclease HII
LKYCHEKKLYCQGFSFIVGVDEAGRGPLAGPVIASAVCLRDSSFKTQIRDSKKMSSDQREQAYEEIMQKAHIGIGIGSVELINRINILNATFYAMTEAVINLKTRMPLMVRDQFSSSHVYLLIDGNRFKTTLPYAYETIIRGDNTVLSIACASIIAKVTRDRLMVEYACEYPDYGFDRHKGYPTLDHKKRIAVHGLCAIHRKHFNVLIR